MVGKGCPENAMVIDKPYLGTKKYRIYVRDNGTCQFCLTPILFSNSTLDHLIPRHFKGDNDPSNLVTACHQCNNRKGNKTPLMYFLEVDGWFSNQRLRLLIGRERARRVIKTQLVKIDNITRDLRKLDREEK